MPANIVPPVLLLTRPAAQSNRFAATAQERLAAHTTVVSPLIEIVQRRLVVQPSAYRGLVFTSENGVDAFAAMSDVRDLPVWCVGNRTACAARAAGFGTVVSAAPDGGDAEGLLALLQRTRPEAPLLHLRGDHARGDLAPRLSAAGLRCDAAIVYDQQARPASDAAAAALAGETPVVVPLFSPRSATLCAQAAEQASAPLFPVAISVAAARAWQALRPEAPIVAQRPDSAAMLDALAGIVEGIGV